MSLVIEFVMEEEADVLEAAVDALSVVGLGFTNYKKRKGTTPYQITHKFQNK